MQALPPKSDAGRAQQALAWRWRVWRAIGVVVAILLAIRAQVSLDRHLPIDAVLVGVVAIAFLLSGFYADFRLVRAPGGDGVSPRPSFPPSPPILAFVPGPVMGPNQRLLLQVGLAWVVLTAFLVPFTLGSENPLTLVNYPDGAVLAQNSLTPAGLVLWLGGLLMVVGSLADTSMIAARLKRAAPHGAFTWRYDWSTLGLLAAVALAVLYRFWDLAGVPLELTSDHTEKLKDVALVLGGLRPVFLPNNGGREAMEFYWIALLVRLGLPLAFISLKIGMGVVSVLAIPVVYRLGRELGGKLLGVASALVLAMLPWHIQITRIGLRIAFSPLFAALALYLVFRALRTGRRNDWIALGLALGFGLYGYTGFRMMFFAVPVIVVLAVALWAWRARRMNIGATAQVILRPLVGHLVVAALVTVVSAAPLIRFAADQPEAFWGRSMTRMTSSERPLEHPPAQQLAINTKNALLMFNVTADTAWFHSPPGRPALETVGGGLFVLGVLAALYFVFSGAWQLASLLPVILIMLLPSALALAFPNEVPHLSRSAGAIPAVAVLTALPLVVAGRWLQAAIGRLGALAAVAFAGFIFLQMGQNTWQRYFHEYRDSYDRSTHRPTLAAKVAQGFIDTGGDLSHVYNVGWDNGWDYRVIGIQLGHPDWEGNLWGAAANGSDAAEAARAHLGDPARKLYLVGGPDAEARVAFLKTLYPRAMATHHPVPGDGKDFWSLLVPEAEPPAATPTADPFSTAAPVDGDPPSAAPSDGEPPAPATAAPAKGEPPAPATPGGP